MAGTSSAKTRFALLPGHDDVGKWRYSFGHCHGKRRQIKPEQMPFG
jgi:hypothetical protein